VTEVAPRIAIVAVIFAYGSHWCSDKVWTPLLSRDLLRPRLIQSLLLRGLIQIYHSTSWH
jgi:hypothetical protein